MWLSDIANGSSDETGERKDLRQSFRSSSPPLEGGEALCEFFVEQPKQELRNEARDIGEIKDSNIQSQEASVVSASQDGLPSKHFLSLLEQEIVPKNTFTQSFLQSILSSVDSHDPLVANAWMETLLDVIDLLPKDIIKKEILTLAVNKGQMSQPVPSRLLCCRMLGKLCTKFDPYVIRKEVLPVVLSLSQDLDHEVRGYMCRQLSIVARGIGLEAAKSAILPELVELANDEESFVRIASIETVVQMLPLLDDETKVLTITPLVKKFCENSLCSQDSTLPVIAKQLGQLCHGLSRNLSIEERLWFLRFFQELAKLGLPLHKKSVPNQGIFSPMPDLVPELENRDRLAECRWACAYNFPAMVLFAERNYFRSELHETFSNLCRDPFLRVKKTLASGFYEIVKLLDQFSPLVMPELTRLLASDSVEVLKGIIPHLPKILEKIFQSPNEKQEIRETDTTFLVQAIMCCEVTTSISSNWRLHAQLLTQYSTFSECLSPDVIFRQFVPLLLVKLYSSRPIPCRNACAYSLLILLRHLPKLEQRNGIVDKLIRDLCYGRSCHKRMLFFTVCDLVLNMFSSSFFKRHFFKPILKLCDDPVPNIRLRLCTILPKLKCLIKLPKDGALLEDLESCVRSLMTEEKDRDVLAAVCKVIEELDKIEVPTELATLRLSVDVESNFDDLRKEEEERKLIQTEFGLGNSSLPSTPFKMNRNGKIPIRKSLCGTLPKSTKAREFKSNTLTKAMTQANMAKRILKRQEHDVLADQMLPAKSAHDYRRDPAIPQYSSPKHAVTKFPCRSDSPSMEALSLRPDVSPGGSGKYVNRCVSPMLPFKRIESDSRLYMSSMGDQKNSHDWNYLAVSEVKMRDGSKPRYYNGSAACRRSTGDIMKPATPIPSPEISRRLPSSRIPMASTKLPSS